MKRQIIFLNGKFVPEEEAKISALDPGFLLGLGVFETMRFHRGLAPGLTGHIQRLKTGSAGIGLKFPRLNIRKIIKEACRLAGKDDVYLRITLWESSGKTGIMLLAKEYMPPALKKYREGFQAGISSLRRDENYFFTRIKSTNRIFYEIPFREARKKGFDEAIILNAKGHIVEATRSNVFIVKDNRILTPALSCGCLEGVTRGIVLGMIKKGKIKVFEALLDLEDLYYCDEAFLTNSLIGIMPLTSCEGHKIGNGKIGPITEKLVKQYSGLIKNGI